jgi:hypothetical protein
VPCAPLVHPALKSDHLLSRGELLARVGFPPTRNIPLGTYRVLFCPPRACLPGSCCGVRHRTVGAAPHGTSYAGKSSRRNGPLPQRIHLSGARLESRQGRHASMCLGIGGMI